MLEHDARQPVGSGQLLQYVLGRGGLARRSLAQHRQLQLLEQDLLQLAGRLDVEFVSGFLVRLGHELLQLLADLAALRPQQLPVDQHAVLLHAQQHGQQRLLEFLIEPVQRGHALDLRPQHPMQAQCHVRVFGGVLRRPVHGHLVEGQLLSALARDFLVRDRAHAEITQRRRVHAVVCGDAVPDIGLEHRVEAHAGEIDAIVGEHVRVVLEMVAELCALGIFENRLKRSEHPVTIELLRRTRVVMVQGHVGSHARLDAERYPDNLGAHVVEAGRLRIERKQLGRPQRLQPTL